MKKPRLRRDRRGCVRRSAQERRELIEAYRTSGLSRSAFCLRQDLPLPTFCGWLKKRPAFTEVSLPADKPAFGTVPPPTARLQIELPRGLCVQVYDVNTLEKLAPFIREVCSC